MIKLFAGSTKTSMPAKNRSWYGHVDGGGTYTRVTISDRRTHQQVYHRTFVSNDYKSVDEIVLTAFREAGGVPERVVFALAGPCDLEKGRVTFTNRESWPQFTLAKIEKKTGLIGKLHNDLELAAADAGNTAEEYLTVIRPGRIWLEGRVVVLTLSTGLNLAVEERGHSMASEFGYIGITPLTDDERSFVNFVAKKLKVTYPAAEQLLGGAHGFRHGLAWLKSLGEQPSAETAREIRKLVREKKGLGPAISGGLGRDPFCDRIMYVIGGLYGTYVRQVLVALQPTGGLHLVGGVNLAMAEILADPKHTPFLERINDPKLPFHDRVKGFAIMVNHDETLMHRGAKVLAGRL